MDEKTLESTISQDEGYFAAKESEQLSAILKYRAEDWFNTLVQNNYLEKIRRCWLAYHGAYYDDVRGGHTITFGGEQGELVNLPVNHFRNIADHILVMVTANRPGFKARSTNTDYKSIIQTRLANSLLEYYMREERLEKYLHRAVQFAIVMGSGYIKMEWNSTSGEIIDYDEESDTPYYAGDVKFTNLSPYDVVFDPTKEDPKELDWVITRSWKNKYDLAEKYPEKADEIKKLETKTEISRFRLLGSKYDKTVDIPVYEFWHKPTESLPEGRYLLYLASDLVLSDSPMPYRDLPVYRISPADILGTPYGYTSMFDLLPLQDAVNSLYSTVLTNQNATGVQNILSPRGADISASQLAGGLNFIEYNGQAGKPESLNLTNTPAEVFKMMDKLIADMETLSGVNSVARGNPEASLKSGNALALIQSQSLQFISGLQQQYVHLIEDVGTGLINMLKDFAAAPRVAAIVGKDMKSEMREFTGDDISTVNRVLVDVANPLSQTTAGRVQMAEQMLQMYGDKLPIEQYINVIETGKLKHMTDGIADQLSLVRAENERLADGDVPVQAIDVDDHALHIKEHRNVLSDPELRQDAELVQRVLNHIQEHITALQSYDSNTLAILGQQPLGPPGGSPVSPENAAGQAAGPGGAPMPPTPEEAAQFGAQGGQMPSPAQPAPSPDGGPVLPSDMPLNSGQ
jgi:hypothetical protein